jgi:hypothetical protein
MTKEEMERTVLKESWRRNGPVGPSLEVVDEDDDDKISRIMLGTKDNVSVNSEGKKVHFQK